MISGGNVTVMVSDMDRAVRFYGEVLGLKLRERYGDHWATVEAGDGLRIGLHPASSKYPAPGTKGGMSIGLEIDEPIRDVMRRMEAQGVRFSGPVVEGSGGLFADFEDPDGNRLYLWDTQAAVKH
jgi:predicted enzyme related to lactoylglutathione lyase